MVILTVMYELEKTRKNVTLFFLFLKFENTYFVFCNRIEFMDLKKFE